MTAILPVPVHKGGRFSRRSDFFKGFLSGGTPQDTTPLFDPDDLQTGGPEVDEPNHKDLNIALRTLVDVFPDVQPEVFREMLLNLSEESRLEVVTEHLLKNKGKWVQGRYRRARPQDASLEGKQSSTSARDVKVTLPAEQTFRSKAYKHAVKAAFYQEFKNLGRSSIKAVLAEQNYSYTLSRPVLQQLTSMSWRASIASLLFKRKSLTSAANDHPLVEWQEDLSGGGKMLPCLRRTASVELNRELFSTLIAPYLAQQREALLELDSALASQLNEKEAEAADALLDCECCYTPTVFEQMSTCDTGCHLVCFKCIRHAINEALYGQGWARNIDLQKTSIRCLAASTEECHGCVPTTSLRQALMAEKDGEATWRRLDDRITSECLMKSRLPLSQCPFCPYAELDETPDLVMKEPSNFVHSLCRHQPTTFPTLIGMVLSLLFYPLLYFLLPTLLQLLSYTTTSLHTQILSSRTRISRRRRGLKFTCRSPSCAATSCISCASHWSDPHTCHETSLQSLRHAIEAATTRAIKRTCPKCHLSFVKSSGCNKLVCNCGYTMCYVCRAEIGREGYVHFCQHFRERRGPCGECERCDLYGVEDEEGVIRAAARVAETEWREQEGKAGGLESGLGKGGRGVDRFGDVAQGVLAGRKIATSWTFEGALDTMLDAVLA